MDSSDSDRESEDKQHGTHGMVTLNSEAETFLPRLGNGGVVDLVNLKTDD